MLMTPAQAACLLYLFIPFDPLPALRAYRGPKLEVITPRGDTPHALHKLVPDLPHKLVTGTSHWPHMDKPDEFNRIMEGFLTTI